jgi:hypothetical protein
MMWKVLSYILVIIACTLLWFRLVESWPCLVITCIICTSHNIIMTLNLQSGVGTILFFYTDTKYQNFVIFFFFFIINIIYVTIVIIIILWSMINILWNKYGIFFFLYYIFDYYLIVLNLLLINLTYFNY